MGTWLPSLCGETQRQAKDELAEGQEQHKAMTRVVVTLGKESQARLRKPGPWRALAWRPREADLVGKRDRHFRAAKQTRTAAGAPRSGGEHRPGSLMTSEAGCHGSKRHFLSTYYIPARRASSFLFGFCFALFCFGVRVSL